MGKAREFSVIFQEQNYIIEYVKNGNFDLHKNYQMIEKSAYDKAIAELDELKLRHSLSKSAHDLAEQDVEKLTAERDAAVEALKQITKNQYGAQGYVEEGDIEGLASYWAQVAIGYQDIAREALNKIKKGAGECLTSKS